MGVRMGTALSHLFLLPFGVLVMVVILRLYALFRATEAGRAWRVGLGAAGSFVLHQLSCLVHALVSAPILLAVVRATGFLTFLCAGATVLVIYRTFASRIARRADFADRNFKVRRPAVLLDGDGKGRKPPIRRPGRRFGR